MARKTQAAVQPDIEEVPVETDAKEPTVEMVAEEPTVEVAPEEEKAAQDYTELAQFVQALVANFITQHLAELDQRIRDLEVLVGNALNSQAENTHSTVYSQDPFADVPDYVAPWTQV